MLVSVILRKYCAMRSRIDINLNLCHIANKQTISKPKIVFILLKE
ncbi:hypothetical protein CKA32_006040 [Geitlerinema sp. FC II]|nr:hypothetical protein CKA32_006040 [Geitlerinema sp. FC II]